MLAIPDRLRPEKVLELLWIGPRLAAAGLRLTGSTLRGVADLLDRSSGPTESASDEDRLWTPPDRESTQNGSGDLDSAAAPRAEATGTAEAPPPTPAPTAEPEARVAEPEIQAEPAPTPVEPSPAHVSEEPTLVAEVADAGAEEGAGAELHIDEPWAGYARMTAPEIVDRLAVESVEVNAVVELYERSHRRRRTVLDAAEREVRRRSGPGARS